MAPRPETDTAYMTATPEPVTTVHLFRPLHVELMSVVETLTASEWQAPTICGAWRVRDVAAHLLDTMLRRLSFGRDRLAPPPSERLPASYDGLVAHLDRLNADWVRAAHRLSPRVIRELLAWAGPQVAEYVAGLPPDGEATFPVAWAAETRSANWMDVGREYTEQWLHQQHVRLGVHRPLLEQRRWLHPVLALFARALPRAYAGVQAEIGTAVVVEITGEAAQCWTLQRGPDGWSLETGAAREAAAILTVSAADAWRLFSKSLRERAPSDVIAVAGNPGFAEPLLAARAIMG